MNWQLSTQAPALKPDEIHIWRSNFEYSKAQIDRWHLLLSPDECERAHRFKTESLQSHYIICRGILRSLLSGYSGIPAKEIVFQYNEQGKPSLKNYPGLHFNLSHTCDYVALAFKTGQTIGVDIEKIKDRRLIEVAERFFSSEEYNALCQLNKADQKRAFFQIWTQKEAFIKATGFGLSYGLDQFGVSVTGPGQLTFIQDESDHIDNWHLETFSINDDHPGAFATNEPPSSVAYFNYAV